MQENARVKYESGGCARVTQGNAEEYRRIQGNARRTYGSGFKVPGECWGMQESARGTIASGCKQPGKYRGMQENARETYGSGCKVPGEYRGMPGEHMGVGAKCQGDAGECRGMPGEHMGVGVNCQGNAVHPGECQKNKWERVYSARRMQETTRVMQGSG